MKHAIQAMTTTKPLREFGLNPLSVMFVVPDSIGMLNIPLPLKKKILLLVDCQLDFIPDPTEGRHAALPVAGADTKIPRICEKIAGITASSDPFDLIIITCDNHPHNHSSFGKSPSDYFQERVVHYSDGTNHTQTVWPPHCVQGSEGVKIDPKIVQALLKMQQRLGEDAPPILVCPKGEGEVDCYSALETILHAPLPLSALLPHICASGAVCVLVGFALDVCVAHTAVSLTKIPHTQLKVIIDTQATAAVYEGAHEQLLQGTAVELR